jgi:hypothetical protein
MQDRLSNDATAEEQREQEVVRLVDEYLARRASGELIADEQILEQHPELQPQLGQQLDRLKRVTAALTVARNETNSVRVSGIDETTDLRTPNSTSLGLTIRCPLCRHAFAIRSDAELNGIICPTCQNRFSLAGDDRESIRAAAVATIAHFELLERVGMGGFGTVWKAHDTQLDRVVALKIPRQGRLGSDEVDDFLHEARIAARLQHRHIVRVFEIGRDQDTVYIVSEFMDGRSLAVWSAAHRPTAVEVAQLVVHVCRAVDYAHQQGVIHRDLKPGNILMDETGEPHITDFGLARREVTDVTVTMDGRILGTPAYMSPEQAQGMQSSTDRRSDVYALGVILFQLLTGELPFRGNVQVLIHKAIHNEAPRVRSLNATIPPDLDTICGKCLEKEPARRYQTAGALADELERFLREEPILARPIGALARTWRWCRRHPAIPGLYAAVTLVLLAVHVSGWLWFESAYREADQALTNQSLTALRFAADSVALSAARELEDRMTLVERIANSPAVRSAMYEIPSNPELSASIDELNRPDLDEDRRDLLRQSLKASPIIQTVQQQLESQSRSRPGVFGWFVLERDGLQIARTPMNTTVGQNYAWRAYFHGGRLDFSSQQQYLASEKSTLRHTVLSPAFLSQVTDRWVIVISAPIFARVDADATEESPGDELHPSTELQKFLGIVGIMFELGHFADLPGADLPGEPRGSEFAVLVDSRSGNGSVVLQHPLYERVLAETDSRLPDRFHHYRIPRNSWRRLDGDSILYQADYHDPLADDPMGEEYRQRWLAVQVPIPLRTGESGLGVVVQESYQRAIGDDLQRLRARIQLLSASTLGLVIVLVIPTWALVMRLMRRSYV